MKASMLLPALGFTLASPVAAYAKNPTDRSTDIERFIMRRIIRPSPRYAATR
jgi:hypothetical protein